MFATKRVMLPCITPDAHLDLSRSLILAEATDVAQIPMIPGPQYLLLLLLPPKNSKKNRCLLAISGDSACLSMVFSVFDINISSNLGVCQSLAAASDRHTGSTTIWKLDLALYKLPLTQVPGSPTNFQAPKTINECQKTWRPAW